MHEPLELISCLKKLKNIGHLGLAQSIEHMTTGYEIKGSNPASAQHWEKIKYKKPEHFEQSSTVKTNPWWKGKYS